MKREVLLVGVVLAEYFGVVIEDEITKDYEMNQYNMSMERK